MIYNNEENLQKLINYVENTLIGFIDIRSEDSNEPINVYKVPSPWKHLASGNYAAVFIHPEFPDLVVKVYAEGRPGIENEIHVYRRLGVHKSYSACLYYGNNYLVLKRLKGITLYDCLRLGKKIPESVINDIDNALEYAKLCGLNPHDVHAKNVMIVDGKGVVVDVSDFNNLEYCPLWKDTKKAYYKIYVPFLLKFCIPIPELFLNLTRKTYRCCKKHLPHKKNINYFKQN